MHRPSFWWNLRDAAQGARRIIEGQVEELRAQSQQQLSEIASLRTAQPNAEQPVGESGGGGGKKVSAQGEDTWPGLHPLAGGMGARGQPPERPRFADALGSFTAM